MSVRKFYICIKQLALVEKNNVATSCLETKLPLRRQAEKNILTKKNHNPPPPHPHFKLNECSLKSTNNNSFFNIIFTEKTMRIRRMMVSPNNT